MQYIRSSQAARTPHLPKHQAKSFRIHRGDGLLVSRWPTTSTLIAYCSFIARRSSAAIAKCIFKTPEDVKFAKKHLLLIKKEAVEKGENIEEEFNFVKTHYHSQLASSPAAGNYIAIMAITSSLLVGIFSVISLSKLAEIFFLGAILIMQVLICFVIFKNGRTYKKCTTYTIIVNLIDEILKK